jgi:hypothetical protein
LTGNSETLALTPEQIERTLGAALFSACVHMFVGWPQPLWWYATHHSQSPTWPRVVRHLAHTTGHPLHAVAFYEIANFGESGELAELITQLPEAVLTDTFERLLDFKIAHVGDWRREAWQRLLARADEAQLLDRFIARIDAELEGILEDLADLGAWLGNGDLAVRILRLLRCDARAVIEARKLREAHAAMQEQIAGMDDAVATTTAAEVFAGLCAVELARLESEPPRLHGTWGQIGQIFKAVGANAETGALVEARRIKAVERQYAIMERFDGAPPRIHLEGWVDQARLGRQAKQPRRSSTA